MIGAGLFKSSSEKLTARLADLEAQIGSLTKRAEEGRVAEAEAQDKLVQDLAEGLPVDDWRKKREAAEKKAAEAERDLKAAQDAAELVRGKLEQAQAAELLENLRKRYAAVQSHAPDALQKVLATGRAFSEAYGRLEGLRSEEKQVIWQLRQAGDRETQICGVPLAESALSDALGHAEGRQSERILIPFWPTRPTP
jgi:chromosome segregation ATPase